VAGRRSTRTTTRTPSVPRAVASGHRRRLAVGSSPDHRQGRLRVEWNLACCLSICASSVSAGWMSILASPTEGGVGCTRTSPRTTDALRCIPDGDTGTLRVPWWWRWRRAILQPCTWILSVDAMEVEVELGMRASRAKLVR
jgi:hypothetical protein